MRRLPGERIGSEAGRLKNSFIIFFLIFPALSFSQVPLNGFCFRNDFTIPTGFSQIISADLNSNGSSELIFYSSALKHIGVLSGVPKEETVFKEFKIKFEVSQLKQLNNKTGSKNLFAVVERKLRKISIVNIFTDSLSEKLAEISFDSYPENIVAGDIDLDGMEEILVYGSGFDGLSVLYRAEGGIGERKIVTGTSFSEAVFIDLNDDGFKDIAAFDILDNSLRFFVNNTSGIFRSTRTIPYSEKITTLESFDLNNDNLAEIIYAINNRLEILYGDYQSPFKRKKIMKLGDKPTSLIIGDFNGDKFPGIIYSVSNNILNVAFGKSGQEFCEPIPLMKKTSLLDFTQFKSGYKNHIACLTQEGELIVFSSGNFTGQNQNISIAAEAKAIKKFDYENDGIPDIALIDNYDNLLKLVLNNSSGVPAKYYSIPLAEDHTEILVDEFFSFRKIFYCYSKGTPLLEVFRYNFKTEKLNRKQLYAPGELLDVAFQRIDSSFVNIYVLYNKNSKMYLGKFENREVSITFKEYPFIDRNVSAAELFILDEPVVYYWKSESERIDFNSVIVKYGPHEFKSHLSVPKTDETQVDHFGADFFDNEYPSIVSIVQSDSQDYLIVVTSGKVNISKQIKEFNENTELEFGRAFFGEISIKGIINFTVNSSNDNYINKLVYRQNEKSNVLNQMFAAENVSDYFFARLDRKNYFLVYSNSKEGYISIRSLKK
jgi:hypothetical protein